MLQEQARDVCQRVLRQCVEAGSFDVVDDLMRPLAIAMVADIIGIPEELRQDMMPLGEAVHLGEVDHTGTNRKLTDLLYYGAAPVSFSQVVPIFERLVEERRKNPQDDLISNLASASPEELPEKLNVPALLFEQFGAGTNTTVHAFASMILMLNQHPDVLDRIRADRSLIPNLIEETLRLHSPLQARPRVSTRDMEVQGEKVPEGTVALAWQAAANIDPAKFKRPIDFDLNRWPNYHIAFGFGEHVCLGNSLARLELRTAMEIWLDTIVELEIESEPKWADDFILHGLEHLQIRV